MCVHAHTHERVCGLKFILSLHHVGSGLELRFVRLGGKCPYLLSHLTSSATNVLKTFHVCSDAPGGQRKVLDPLELELEVVMVVIRPLTWVQGIKLGSYGSILTCRTILPALHQILISHTESSRSCVQQAEALTG